MVSILFVRGLKILAIFVSIMHSIFCFSGYLITNVYMCFKLYVLSDIVTMTKCSCENEYYSDQFPIKLRLLWNTSQNVWDLCISSWVDRENERAKKTRNRLKLTAVFSKFQFWWIWHFIDNEITFIICLTWTATSSTVTKFIIEYNSYSILRTLLLYDKKGYKIYYIK